MILERNAHRVAAAAMLLASAMLTACAHKASAAAQINDGFAPFSSARNLAVGLVAQSKRSLGPADVNTLDVAYTALEEKANGYASFMVEAISTSSFDSARNSRYAADFAKALAAFDKSYAALATTRAKGIAGSWVSAFAQSLQARWNEYGGVVGHLSPQTKADLIAGVKRATVWPNYEDIATEPLVSSR